MSSFNTNKNRLIEQSILSLKDNNFSAMDDLYKLIKDDIYAFALSKVSNKFDADDIMQDTFIQIYKNVNLYESQGKPLAWIFTIENNLINRFYQLKNRQIELDEKLFVNIPSDENITYDLNDDFLNSLLNKLSKEEKEIIVLHIVSSLKFIEIAKLLSMPLATVLSKYNRALKKLKKLVKEKNYEN